MRSAASSSCRPEAWAIAGSIDIAPAVSSHSPSTLMATRWVAPITESAPPPTMPTRTPRPTAPGRARGLLAGIGDENQLARDDIDEFGLPLVPVPLRRRAAGRYPQQVDAEIAEAEGVAEPPPLPRRVRCLEGVGIVRAADGLDRH